MAGAVASIVATILTFPIQKLRIIWQGSRQEAVHKIQSACYAVNKYHLFVIYELFFTGIRFKIAETILKSFLFFFFMEEIGITLQSYWVNIA